MGEDYYETVGRYYDKDSLDYDKRYWSNSILQNIRQEFREELYKISFSNALEIGFGTGIDLIHFGRNLPERNFFGLDVSKKMVQITKSKIKSENLGNIKVKYGSSDSISENFPNKKFDLIYVFFGALNTVENFNNSARILYKNLNEDGHIIVSFVNKFYLADIFINLMKLNLNKAFLRQKKIWGGYSPTKFLESKCVSAKEVRKAFSFDGIEIKRKGFSITYPAWYRDSLRKKLGFLNKYLSIFDDILNKTPLWQFGEYSFFIFKKK